jgi:cation diffusion facilitator CzcD-associated flavoprotein CzcO
VCDNFQINDKIQVNTDVTEMRWLEEEELWEMVLTHMVPGTGDMSRRERQDLVEQKGPPSVYLRQEIVRAKIVLSGAGAFVEPNAWPTWIPGQGEFEGRIFHSARWKQDIDLVGKDVVVIGTGCSAAQFVPVLTKAPYSAKTVTQIMRSPPWVLPKTIPPNAQRKWEKWAPFLFKNIPGLARICRFLVFCLSELDFFTYFRDSPRALRQRKKLEAKLLQHMKKSVPEKYHEILTPDYNVMCKRRIFDDEWFSALRDPQVELTTRPLASLQPRGITLGPGRTFSNDMDVASKAPADVVRLPADVIILANGYEITTWLHPMKVRGRGGVLMQEVWDERGGAQAYMGAAMDGFPNFFLIFGPNTATGHSSVILASENMVNYSLHFIKKILAGDVKTVEVKKTAEIAWTKEMQDQLKHSVVGSGGCHSWYKTSSGWNSTAYP